MCSNGWRVCVYVTMGGVFCDYVIAGGSFDCVICVGGGVLVLTHCLPLANTSNTNFFLKKLQILQIIKNKLQTPNKKLHK